MSKEKSSYDEILLYYKEKRKIYEEFKEFRKKLGKPLRPFVAPAKETREILSSKGFSELLEEVKSKREPT